MDERYSGWTGLAGFAGILLVIAGVFGIIQGFVALFSDSYFLATEGGLLIFDYTSWGWIHMGIGVLLLAAGSGVLAGQTWAIVTGVIIASANAIAQLAFLSAYPVWGVMVIALDVMIVYALATHGRYLMEETAETRSTTTPPQDIRRVS